MLDVGQGPLERPKDCSGMMREVPICFEPYATLQHSKSTNRNLADTTFSRNNIVVQAIKDGKLKTATRVVSMVDDKIEEALTLTNPDLTLKVCYNVFISFFKFLCKFLKRSFTELGCR